MLARPPLPLHPELRSTLLMNWLPLLLKSLRRAAALIGATVVFWFLSPLLGLEAFLVASVLAYLSGRTVLTQMLARSRGFKAFPKRSIRTGAIGVMVGATVLAIGAEQMIPGSFSGFFGSSSASSIEASSQTEAAKIDKTSAGTQTAASFELPSTPLASSVSIDLSLIVALTIAVLAGRSHILIAARNLRYRLQGLTSSPHGLAILALLGLAVIALGSSRAPTVPSAPVASKAIDERTGVEKRAVLEGLLAEKLLALRQLEAPLQGATPARTTKTNAFDDMSLWRNTSRPNPIEIETLRADINKIVKELGDLGS